MKKKIKILYSIIEMLKVASSILCGMSLALFIYRKHLCCDKDGDWIFYILTMDICIFLMIVLCELKSHYELKENNLLENEVEGNEKED